jgi:RHS repeat-associated protein
VSVIGLCVVVLLGVVEASGGTAQAATALSKPIPSLTPPSGGSATSKPPKGHVEPLLTPGSSGSFARGQVFASVGYSTVNVYDPKTGDEVNTLVDDTDEPYTTGSAFDASDDFYVTDDTMNDISEFSPTGAAMGQFATGLDNPESLVFDNKGNLYVGQQSTPYIAEFSPSGTRLADIGPLSTELFGDDWIDLAPDQCTFYYTTEGTDILRYNKCTNTQESNFNTSAFTGYGAFELRILPDGDVLVADSASDLLLDPSGNVIETYACSSLPGCQGELFNVALDPDGTSFWTGDAISGDVWRVDLATGDVVQRIETGAAGLLFGLSIDGEPEAAAGLPEGGVLTAAETWYGGAATECPCLTNNGHHGEPVNPMDGDFYENDTDLTVPGPGVGLGLSRSYDAMAAQSGVTGPLGPGWADDLNMSVALNMTTSEATVTESSGAQVTFVPYDASTPWCPTSKNYCPTAPRDIATLNHNGDGSWTFTDDLGTPVTYLFSSGGALEEITNSAGQSIAGSSEAPGTGSGSSACPSSAASCTVWLSNAATPNPTLTEIFDSSAQLIEAVGFAGSGGTPPSVTFCYYGETACSPPSSGGNAGSLYSVTDPGGLTTAYTYDNTNGTTQYQDDLLTRTDPDGHQLVNTYNTTGQISGQTDPNGAVSTYTYAETSGLPPGDGVDNTTTASDAQGTGLPATVTTYTYTYGELVATTLDPGSSTPSVTTTVRSEVTGQIVDNIDPNGSASDTALPNPNSSGNSYLTDIDPTATTDALGNATLYAYTASNQVWCQIEPSEVLDGVTCPSTEPTTAPTPGSKNTVDLGATITYYDTAGNPTYVTDPLGNTTETAYTSAEQPWCSVDAAEFTTAGKYCPSSPPTSPPTGTVTGYTTTLYSAAGNETSVTTPNGATTTYGYTNANFPSSVTSSTDPQGDVTGTTLDSAGRPVTVVQSFGSYSATTVTAYDAAGRAFCTIGALAYSQGDTTCPSSEPTSPPTAGSDPWPGDQITIFNGDGQPLDQVNALGGVTQTAYNSAGQPYCSVSAIDYAAGTTCPTSPLTSAPTGTATGYTTTIYDAEGRTASVTDPIGDTTTSTYDPAGNLISSGYTPASTTHDPVQVTDYQFDADDQQIASCTNADGAALDAPGTCGQATVESISCGSTTSCVGIDDNADAMVLSGTTWGIPIPIGAEQTAGHVPSAISCPTSSFCIAVDKSGDALSYNGSSWASSLTTVDTQALTSVSCASATFCLALDGAGNVSVFNGTSWSTPSNPDSAGTIDALSCPSATFCMAVDPSGNYLTYNGTSWSAPTNEGDAFVGVSCSSATFCGAISNNGSAFIDSSGTWTSQFYGQAFVALACVASTCQFATNDGHVDTYSGGTWGGSSVDNGVAFTSIACASSTMCEASDAEASILGYNGTNWTATPGLDEPASSADTTTLSSYDPDGDVYCAVSANAYAKGPKTYQCPTWQAGWIASPPRPDSLYSTTPSASEANQVTTTFDDANGNQVQSTNPDVETTLTVLDADGRTYCSADATNVASWLSAHSSGTYPYLCPSSPPTSAPSTGSNPGYVTTIFDAQGNTLSSSDQAGDTTSYTYNSAGQVLTTTDPRGKVSTDCYYDQNGSGQCANAAPSAGGLGSSLYSTATPVTTTDPSGEVTTDTYFPGGQSDAGTNPAGTTTDAYDAMGDLSGVTYSNTAGGFAAPTNLAYTYNQDGSRHTMVDATGTTTYGYDDNGDVTSQALAASTGLANTTTDYGYDAAGTLGSVTYPSYAGHSSPQVTYSYDTTGAMTSATDWLGNVVSFGHDASGNTTAQDNNVSGTNPNGTSSTSFSYDAANQNTSAKSTINQTCGSSENVTQSFSGSSGARNADGQLTQYGTSYSATCSGQTSSSLYYSYDLVGRVMYQGSAAQGSSPNTFAYDAAGDPTTISSHNATGGFDTYSQSFDNAGEVTSQSPTAGPGGAASSYSYDTLGDQNQASTAGAGTTNDSYNQAAQLTSASTPTANAGYLYTGDGLEGASTTPSGSVVWGSPTDIDTTRAIDAVSCPSSSFCAAVGTSGTASTYNGSTWSGASDADSSRTLDAVSCPSSSFCVAVDTSGNATLYNGTSWSSPLSIDSTRHILAVTCTSSSFCVAVGMSGYATLYNGSSWTPSDIDASRNIDAVTCTSSSFCVAVDTTGHATTYNGSIWLSTPSDPDSTRDIDALSCAGSSLCVAGDTSGYVTVYNGSTWSTPSDVDASRSIKALSCPTSSECVAVDTSGYSTIYNGSSWSTPSDIDGSNALEALSCAGASFCEASDNTGNVLTYNGSNWSGAIHVDGTRSIDAIACAASTFCAAADASGYATLYALVSDNWAQPTDVNSTNALNAVSCVSSSFCVTVGASGMASVYNGSTWSSAADVDSTRTLDAVSCTSSSFCVAVDTSGYETTFNGSTWSSPSDIDSTHSIDALTCISASFCVAVDTAGYATTFNASTWSTPSHIDSHILTAVTCASATFCVAVGDNGYGVIYTGSWASAVDIDGIHDIDTVACASSSMCVAAGASGYDSIYNGSSWSTPSDIDSTRTIEAVACPSTSLCTAVDGMGYALTYNGSGWSSPTDIDGSHPLEALSCAGASSCQAADSAGDVLAYNGTSWYLPENVDGTRSINAISCPSATFCATGDGSGYALTYTPPGTTVASQLTWDTNGSLPLVLSDASSDYIYGPSGTPFEQISLSTSTPTYLTYSESNDTWLSTNSAGDETGFWGYDAFGNLAFGTPTSSFGYSGQYVDATSSLVNDRARWYSTQTGGFTSRDPAFASTDTAYTYAGGDPVNQTDPTGDAPNGLFGVQGAALTSNPCSDWVADPTVTWHTYINVEQPFFISASASFKPYGYVENEFGVPVEDDQIGTVNLTFSVALSGRQVKIAQSIDWASGPAIQPRLNWQCWESASGQICPSSPAQAGYQPRPGSDTYDHPGWTTNKVTWPAPPSVTGPYLTGRGPFTINLNWNFASQGNPNRFTPNGRWNVTPYISPKIHCNPAQTATCKFDTA